ncbi:MAG: phage major capsid protein [Patescibacteria group bacterium]|nr:phage major capsid protein [Patescibacteria group bacterium]
MDPKLKELLEKYDNKVAEQKGLLSPEGREPTQEDVTKATELNAEIDALDGEIKTFMDAADLRTKAAARESLGTRASGTVNRTMFHFEGAGAALLENGSIEQFGPGIMTEKQWKAIHQPGYEDAFRKYISNKAGFGGLSHVEQKLLQEGVDDGGGYLAPEEFVNQVLMKKPTPTRLVNFVTTWNTTRDSLRVPRVNYPTDDIYTTGIRATFTGEVPPTSTSSRVTDPIFGSTLIPMFTAMMSIPVTEDLLEDSAVSLMPWLTDRFGETVPLLKDNMILNGTGVNQPTGILTNAGKVDGNGNPLPGSAPVLYTGANGLLDADTIIDAAWALPEQYDEDARWVFNKTNTGRRIAKLKDGEGRFVWSDGLQDSGIMRMTGYKNRELQDYPVALSQFAPNSTDSSGAGIAGATPIVFGDLHGYSLVNRVGFSIRVLTELYAELNQILLLGRLRFGGLPAEEWRLRVIQQSAS